MATVISPLLALPDGVENHLLSFVSSGERGLQSILNLRQVCSTTKSWVDNLPKEQAKQIFSRAKVYINSDDLTPTMFVESLRRFLEAPPPVAITALSLNVQGFYKTEEPTLEEKQLWKDFLAFWSPKLETLQLINHTRRRKEDEFHPWTFQILGISSIRKLTALMGYDFFWEQSMPLPAALKKIEELGMEIYYRDGFGDDFSKRHFYSQLVENSNLRKYEVYFQNHWDLDCLREFIDAKRNDTKLVISITAYRIPEVEIHEFGAAFIRFMRSVAASKSDIQLKLHEVLRVDLLQNVRNALEDEDQLSEVLRRITEIGTWKPSVESLPLLLSLPQLQKISRFDVDPEFLERQTLLFPETLRDLGVDRGFPSPRCLPLNLTQLKLNRVTCDEDSLKRSLTTLSSSCPCLETLKLTWNTQKPTKEIHVRNPEESAGVFGKLKSLKFTALLDEDVEDVGGARAIILKGFQVGSLQLLSLDLRFKVKDQFRGDNSDAVPSTLNEDLLNELCEGSVGSSLVAFWCDEESVTPGGLPLLQRLRSKTSENRKRREDTIGRGEWQRAHKIPLPRID